MRPYLGLNAEMPNSNVTDLEMGKIVYFSAPSPDPGRKNEDSFGFWCSNRQCVLAVADGLGGHSQGDIASEMAMKELFRGLSKNTTDINRTIQKNIERINKKLRKTGLDIGTTLTVAHLNNNQLRFYSVGDSIGALLSKSSREYKTFEHSVTGLATESGVIDEVEAMDHPESHVILNSLGEEFARMELSFNISIRVGDRVLLMTDGVSGNITFSDIKDIVLKESLPEAGRIIVDRCSQKMATDGTKDDFTFLIYEK